MAAKRVEIAHFWQDHCLSIGVFRSLVSYPEGWLDAGETTIRIRNVAPVPVIRSPSRVGWLPFALFLASLCVVAVFDDEAGLGETAALLALLHEDRFVSISNATEQPITFNCRSSGSLAKARLHGRVLAVPVGAFGDCYFRRGVDGVTWRYLASEVVWTRGPLVIENDEALHGASGVAHARTLPDDFWRTGTSYLDLAGGSFGSSRMLSARATNCCSSISTHRDARAPKSYVQAGPPIIEWVRP